MMTSNRLAAFAFVAALAVPSVASAHVFLTSPEEGATVASGSTVHITWDIAVNHGPPDTYDLMFSRDGGAQYQMLVDALPSSVNEYDWTAPDTGVPNAVLAILQHGSGGYEYMHTVAFTVDGPGGTDPDMGVPDGGFFDAPDATEAVVDDGGVPTTGEEVGALLEKRCGITGCHAAENPQAGLVLTSAAFPGSLVDAPSTKQDGATLVVACDSGSSELLARLRGDRALRMPSPPEVPFSDQQMTALTKWIDAGAHATGPIGTDTCTQASLDGDTNGCSTAPGGAPARFGWLAALFVVGLTAGFRRFGRGR